jgi:predicted  nucleic acid-binding Zn-ribbon protein
MIKYLNVPDFHFALKHSDESIKCGKAVSESARKNEVDFIVVPGDWFDSPIMATDKGGLNIARSIMKLWLSICPVIAIEGTPSHDGPGCYGIFEDMGLIVARPDKVYAFHEGIHEKSYITEINQSTLSTAKAIIFGIPELNKHTIQAQLKLPADQANAEALNLLDQHITEFIAPMRMKYKELPAIGLLHGNVTDSISKETESDRILKRSDILISTEMLAKADLTVWHIGHIHTPWQSEKINAGYAGSPCFDWKQFGFLPAFELVEISDGIMVTDANAIDTQITCDPIIQRIPYGTPRREKVKLPFNNFEDGVAYEIETDDLEYKIPENVHPWSRIKRPETKRETKRVTEEQAKSIRLLWDLFLLADPDVPKDYKQFIDLISEKVKKESGNKRRIEMTYLKIKGSIFFNGQDYELSIEELAEGLNCIHGRIGSGKSSGLAFCSPFPNVIGKDTVSGRPSAIKDFFSGPDCSIEKHFLVNGVIHEHFIVIAKADTQNPKVECSLTIDGIPQLDKGTFDEMFQECEKLYGLFEDFRITTFYEQPQQAKENQSGLMSCGRSEARNVVQHIADVDREQEKRFALDKVSETERAALDLQAGINARKEYIQDGSILSHEIESLNLMIEDEQEELEKCVNDGNILKKSADQLSEMKNGNDILKEQLRHKKEQATAIESEISSAGKEIETCEALLTGLETYKKQLADNAKNQKRYDELKAERHKATDVNNELEKKFLADQNEYNQLVNKQQGLSNLIVNAKGKIETIDTLIKAATKPCEKCGHIAESARQSIDQYVIQISGLQEEIKEAESKIIDLPEQPEEPELMKFDSTELDSIVLIDTEAIQEKINAALKAESKIESIENIILDKSVQLKKLKEEIAGIKINETIDASVSETNEKLEDIRKRYTEIKTKISGFESDLKHAREKRDLMEAKKKELAEDEKKLSVLQKDIDAWKYIASMLSANKIPALELDIIIESIDNYATTNIQPFENGRYSFRTSTQEMGKKSLVDKFDIMIHDSETGHEQSIFAMNPGHKAFFSDSYVKALISKRNGTAFISYSPIILDEADGPIGTEHIPVYYDIQNSYFQDQKVLIVTHSNDAYQFIQNIIEVEDLKS